MGLQPADYDVYPDLAYNGGGESTGDCTCSEPRSIDRLGIADPVMMPQTRLACISLRSCRHGGGRDCSMARRPLRYVYENTSRLDALAYVHREIHRHTHVYVRRQALARAHTHSHTHSISLSPSLSLSLSDIQTHAQRHTQTQTHRHRHTNTHTHTHTHTHRDTHTGSGKLVDEVKIDTDKVYI